MSLYLYVSVSIYVCLHQFSTQPILIHMSCYYAIGRGGGSGQSHRHHGQGSTAGGGQSTSEQLTYTVILTAYIILL